MQTKATGQYKKYGSQLGFTLVELLVVISIIALLLAVLMPALNKARELAKCTVCMSNQRGIGIACVLYTSQNGDHLPDLADWNAGSPPDKSLWYWTILPYMSTNKVQGRQQRSDFYRCPSRTEKVKGTKLNGVGLDCLDFGVNYCVANASIKQESGVFAYGNYPTFGQCGSLKMAGIRTPSRVYALMDTQPGGTMATGMYTIPFVYTPWCPGTTRNESYWAWNTKDVDGLMDICNKIKDSSGTIIKYNNGAFRHGKKDAITVVFVDGHVSKVDKKQWLKPDGWLWK